MPPNDARPLTFAILGCGNRGQLFARWIARHPADARLVAVAEPIAERRNLVADAHDIPPAGRFDGWEQLLDGPRQIDVIINTLMDGLHAPSALRVLDLGYPMLLEKPMAVSYDDCAAIDAARRRSGSIVAVCHSLRYHPVYRRIKELIDAGELGRILSLDQLEGVDPTHQAHSFVRGNWANESRSTFMLLAKSCHDIDILLYLAGRDCLRVSSFGRLSHFTKANQPPGVPARCIEGCPVQNTCPYDAVRTYADGTGYGQWIGLDRLTADARRDFLRASPFGRCVYDCDNDAVDHQVVNFEFDGGATGTFTMTAFAPAGRTLRLHGDRGCLVADIDRGILDLWRYWLPGGVGYGLARGHERITIPPQPGGHGGGDDNVIESLVRAVRANDPSQILTGTAESLRTHTVAFAAERSRREGRVIQIDEIRNVEAK